LIPDVVIGPGMDLAIKRSNVRIICLSKLVVRIVGIIRCAKPGGQAGSLTKEKIVIAVGEGAKISLPDGVCELS